MSLCEFRALHPSFCLNLSVRPLLDVSEQGEYIKPKQRFYIIYFKRNQVEEAISRLVGSNDPGVATRLKRLLDTDRTRGRNPRANDPVSFIYAFYSGEPSGSGVEIWFQEYEAFALLVALKFLDHGFPQQKSVEILRRLRPSLENHHRRVLAQDPAELFSREGIIPKGNPGQLVLSNLDPLFAVVTSTGKGGKQAYEAPISRAQVCRGEAELMPFLREALEAATIIEVATLAYRLHEALSKTKPSQRGRK